MNDKHIQDQRCSADIRFTNPILPIRMLTMAQVEKKVSLGRTKIYELMASDDTFPQSHLIGGGKSKRFIESEIDQWLLDQIQKSRTQPRIKQKVCVKRPAQEGAEIPAKVGVEVPAKGGSK
jgi:predicted DNA-binding transcriptional regulator AlpA